MVPFSLLRLCCRRCGAYSIGSCRFANVFFIACAAIVQTCLANCGPPVWLGAGPELPDLPDLRSPAEEPLSNLSWLELGENGWEDWAECGLFMTSCRPQTLQNQFPVCTTALRLIDPLFNIFFFSSGSLTGDFLSFAVDLFYICLQRLHNSRPWRFNKVLFSTFHAISRSFPENVSSREMVFSH